MLNGVWLISCSLVGDPKTALTIVSHRAFLKFIPVMSDIQRVDAPDDPLWELPKAAIFLILKSNVKRSQPSAAPTG
jgi:hypothetical protein